MNSRATDPGSSSWHDADPATEGTPYRRLGRRLAPLIARRFPRNFGLFELAALGSIEWMRRHLAIINELERMRHEHAARVLDVIDFGGAGGSLGRAIRMYGLERHYRIVTADIEEPESIAMVPPYAGFLLLTPDGVIPARDGEFDIAVSSDVFEHIPGAARSRWASELHRVARLGQVHSVPADSADGRWASTKADLEFALWYEGRFGETERWTAEHLAVGAPTIQELAGVFPGAVLIGIVNCDVWQATMRAKYGPKGLLARARFAARYAATMHRLERHAPYKNALLIAPGRAAVRRERPPS